MNDTAKAVGLLRRVCLAICKRPEEFRMEVEELSGTIEIGIVANPTDTKRLVGRGREILQHLEHLMRLLLRGCKKRVRFLDLEPNGKQEVIFAPFVPNPKWPAQAIGELLRDIVEAIFELPVDVEAVEHNRWSVKMYAVVQGDCDQNIIQATEKVINTLFVPIGTLAGMKVYAHCHDWKARRTPALTAG